MIGTANIGVAVEIDGFAIVEGVLSPTFVEHLLTSLAHIGDTGSMRKRGDIFCRPQPARHIAGGEGSGALGSSPRVSRAYFGRAVLSCPWHSIRQDSGRELEVPWHQDVTIAVQKRVEAERFGPWSTKADVLHVQPPAEVLEHMVSVHLPLDNCGEENGALRIIPGSHLHGRIPEEHIPAMRETREAVCAGGVGGALLMRPLLLHASSPSRVPGHRRWSIWTSPPCNCRTASSGSQSQLRTCNEREQELHNLLRRTRFCITRHASAELQIDQAVRGCEHEGG